MKRNPTLGDSWYVYVHLQFPVTSLDLSGSNPEPLLGTLLEVSLSGFGFGGCRTCRTPGIHIIHIHEPMKPQSDSSAISTPFLSSLFGLPEDSFRFFHRLLPHLDACDVAPLFQMTLLGLQRWATDPEAAGAPRGGVKGPGGDTMGSFDWMKAREVLVGRSFGF